MDQRKIKLIWDFRGTEADKVAEHHLRHLQEYIAAESLKPMTTGTKMLGDLHSIAFMVVDEGDMIKFRDALKPHRGEVY